MLGKMYRHIRHNVKKKDDPNVLLLRLLLLTLVVGVTFLIFKPHKIRPVPEKKEFVINGEKITEETQFRMKTTHICAAVMDAEISLKSKYTIELTFLKKQNSFKQFEPLSPPATYSIKNGDCIPAYSACANMNFNYCFTINTSATTPVVNYELQPIN